jgi:hypothetical protein
MASSRVYTDFINTTDLGANEIFFLMPKFNRFSEIRKILPIQSAFQGYGKATGNWWLSGKERQYE